MATVPAAVYGISPPPYRARMSSFRIALVKMMGRMPARRIITGDRRKGRSHDGGGHDAIGPILASGTHRPHPWR
jgi:hypothetical protein